jgi:opacity protein-like surface antigen
MKILRLVLLVFFSFFAVKSLAQDDDIFGLSKKPKIPKSESALGNITRNLVELFTMEISGGTAFHQMLTPFFSEKLTLYPLYQVRSFASPLVLDQESPLKSRSTSFAFPANAGFRINFLNTITIGLGYGLESGGLAPMKSLNHDFVFQGSTYSASKVYATGGLILYDSRKRAKFLRWKYRNFSQSNYYMQSELKQRVRQNYPWNVVLEGENGFFFLRKSSDPRLVAVEDPYFGIGVRVERDFSEYAKFFVKGGTEFRKFTYTASDYSEIQTINQNIYTLQAGIAFTLSGTERCKVGGCGVVMKHSHNGIEYRGSNIFTFQNRKIGQWR